MRKILCIIASLLGAEAAAAETRYVLVIHFLMITGEYKTYRSTKGVGYTECELRKDAWWAKWNDAVEGAKAELAQKGQYGELTVTCEPVER